LRRQRCAGGAGSDDGSVTEGAIIWAPRAGSGRSARWS
jgi:hypothetical protein